MHRGTCRSPQGEDRRALDQGRRTQTVAAQVGLPDASGVIFQPRVTQCELVAEPVPVVRRERDVLSIGQ